MAHLESSNTDGNALVATTVTDRISSLPDEILHRILSSLHMKHAVGTSILSTRWRYLWTFNPNLDFPLDPAYFNLEGEEYVEIINHCLRLYRCPNINRLIITVKSDQDFSSEIQSWINFATSRGIHQLILKTFKTMNSNFPDFPLRHSPPNFLYSHLPHFLFFHTQLTELLLTCRTFTLPMGFKGFPCLQVFTLFNVSITDNMVQTLLLTCPLLEALSLTCCNDLKNLNIYAPKLGLKILEVCMNGCLKNLFVDAPNLVSFHFSAIRDTKVWLSVPCLLQTGVPFWGNFESVQVEEWRGLVMSMANIASLSVGSWFSKFIFAEYCLFENPHIEFVNLKDFSWSGYLQCEYEILALATFLKDCPLLQKLSLELYNGKCGDWYAHYYQLVKDGFPTFKGIIRNRSTRKDKKRYLQHLDYVLPHLKTIEIVGFSGGNVEMELVTFLLDKAIVLESLLLTTTPKDDSENEEEDTRENLIRNWQLQEHLSHLPKTSLYVNIVLSV